MSSLPNLFKDWQRRHRDVRDFQRVYRNRRTNSRRTRSRLSTTERQEEINFDDLGQRERDEREKTPIRNETPGIQDQEEQQSSSEASSRSRSSSRERDISRERDVQRQEPLSKNQRKRQWCITVPTRFCSQERLKKEFEQKGHLKYLLISDIHKNDPKCKSECEHFHVFVVYDFVVSYTKLPKILIDNWQGNSKTRKDIWINRLEQRDSSTIKVASMKYIKYCKDKGPNRIESGSCVQQRPVLIERKRSRDSDTEFDDEEREFEERLPKRAKMKFAECFYEINQMIKAGHTKGEIVDEFPQYLSKINDLFEYHRKKQKRRFPRICIILFGVPGTGKSTIAIDILTTIEQLYGIKTFEKGLGFSK